MLQKFVQYNTIQYNTNKSFITRTRSRNRIWGAGSRWAGGGVGVG